MADAGSQSPIETDDFRSRAKPILAFANDLEKEILGEEKANLGEKGRYDPSVGAQVVHNKFGFLLPYCRIQDLFSSTGWTPSRSSLNYVTDLVYDATQDLPKTMTSRMIAGNCIGFDDTHVTLIMPKEIPKLIAGQTDLHMQRLIEKMQEAQKSTKYSLDAKMWGHSSFDPSAPYEIFDFQVCDWIGIKDLNYRLNVARTIVNDIHLGLTSPRSLDA